MKSYNLRAVRSGNHGRVFKILSFISRPVRCHDCNLGQCPASSEEDDAYKK